MDRNLTLVWFSNISYNSIHTWDQLHQVFLAWYFPLSKNLNHKDKLNNFVELPAEFISSSSDRFNGLTRSVPTHRINDEFQKE